MVIVDPLALYPGIAALQRESGKGPGAMRRFCERGARWLPELDAALSRLEMGSRPSLRGLVDDLFSDRDKRLFAAVGELLVFDCLKARGLLAERDIGFPADWKGGDDPPFEGALNVGGRSMPFDVKDGSGDVHSLLASILVRQVRAEAERRRAAPPTVHVEIDAPAGQRWLENNFAALVRPFDADLVANGLAPRIINLNAGSGAVRVGLDRGVDGSVVGLEEKASFVAEQIFSHAREKADKLQLTMATEFGLIYVKRPGSGYSDFDSYTVEEASRFLASRSDLPAAFIAFAFVNMDTERDEPVMLSDRYGTLPEQLRTIGDTIPRLSSKTSLKERLARARRVDPADVEATNAVLAGSCDLRGDGCTARGTTSVVAVYFAGDGQLLACETCRIRFGWS